MTTESSSSSCSQLCGVYLPGLWSNEAASLSIPRTPKSSAGFAGKVDVFNNSPVPKFPPPLPWCLQRKGEREGGDEHLPNCPIMVLSPIKTNQLS